jgi:dihydrodipicolinate synthase/N-acetylneuraminate lyase
MRRGLTRDNLHGIWAAIHTPFADDGRIDFDALRENVRRFHAAGVHGIYTTDSDGEFYAIELDEFKQLADVFAAECRRLNFPSMMGVTWTNTQGIVDRLKVAAERGIMGAHVGFPFFMPLNEPSREQFWHDVSGAVPDSFGLIHYNTPRQQHVLGAADYKHLENRFPKVIGSKYPQNAADTFIDVVANAPKLSFFVAEPVMTPFYLLGARGCNSWMTGYNPKFMLDWWDELSAQKWDAALARNRRMVAFTQMALATLSETGNYHGIFTKAVAAASPFLLHRSRYSRKPYMPVSDKALQAFRRRAAEEFPDLAYAPR